MRPKEGVGGIFSQHKPASLDLYNFNNNNNNNNNFFYY